MYALLTQQGQGGYMWYGDGHMVGMHWGWWIFWITAAAFLVWLVARTTGSGGTGSGAAPPPPPRQSPEEVLRERFAKGEITEEEFRERLRVIQEPEEGKA